METAGGFVFSFLIKAKTVICLTAKNRYCRTKERRKTNAVPPKKQETYIMPSFINKPSGSMLSGISVKEVTLDDDYKLPRPLVSGDKVYLVTIGKEGIVTAPKDKNGLDSVTAGILKTKVTEDKLRLMDGSVKFKRKDEPPKVSEGKVKKTVMSSFSPEVDVRGMIGDDAWFVVDKYLDDAILAGIPSVRIIHGKGTGALRNYLHKMLKSDNRVKGFRLGNYGEGDTGVTVIEMKI